MHAEAGGQVGREGCGRRSWHYVQPVGLLLFSALHHCRLCILYETESKAQSAPQDQTQAGTNASPIYGVKVPTGYRDWHLISVERLMEAGGKLKQFRAELSNDIATDALPEGALPLPDGSIIAALYWNQAFSDADNKVLAEGFRGAGLMLRPVAGICRLHERGAQQGALHKTCFSCHEPAKITTLSLLATHQSPRRRANTAHASRRQRSKKVKGRSDVQWCQMIGESSCRPIPMKGRQQRFW